MRGFFLVLALAFGALAPLAGCASLQAVQPHTARETLAAAEITLVGAIQVAQEQVDTGAMSRDDAAKLLPVFESCAQALDLARTALNAGNEGDALRSVAVAQTLLRAIALTLSERAAHAAARNGV